MNPTLKLPRQQRRAWFRRPSALEQRRWVDNLPLDRAEAVLRLVNKRLRDLNFTAMPARRRLRCLAPFQGPLRDLHGQLTAQLGAEQMPLPRDLDSAMHQMSQAWSRMSVGYLCAIRDQRKREMRLVEDAALLALRALARLVLSRAQTYEPVPAGTWRNVHEAHGISTTRRPVAATSDGDANDAETAYKQILMLGATGLNRLRPPEQMALFQVLGEWVRPMAVRRLRNVEPKGPPVVFRPGEDEAPRIYPLEQVPDSPGLRLMDPAPLAGRARQHLNAVEGGQKASETTGGRLAPDSLRALLNAWSGSPARRFPRADTDDAAEIALGLESAWAMLSSGQPDTIARCRLSDRSSSGFRAVIANPAPGTVHVGELVAVREDNESTLGVVRWLQFDRDRAAHLGVESLSRKPRLTRLESTRENPVPAFLVDMNRALDQPATLITPRLSLAEGARVKTVEGRTLTISRCLESTSTFLRFRFDTATRAEH